MSIHSFVDKISISIGSLFFPKYFRDGLESASLKENLDAVEVNVNNVLEE